MVRCTLIKFSNKICACKGSVATKYSRTCLERPPIGHKKHCQDRRSLVTGSVVLKCGHPASNMYYSSPSRQVASQWQGSLKTGFTVFKKNRVGYILCCEIRTVEAESRSNRNNDKGSPQQLGCWPISRPSEMGKHSLTFTVSHAGRAA